MIACFLRDCFSSLELFVPELVVPELIGPVFFDFDVGSLMTDYSLTINVHFVKT
jgi:hypothetical protein